MYSIRGINLPTIQDSPSFSAMNKMTNNTFIHYLRSVSYNSNNTTTQIDTVLNDSSPSILENLEINYIIGLCIIIMIFSTIVSIVYLLEQKGFSFNNIIDNLYNLNKIRTDTQVLPQYYKKAKQCTFMSSLPIPTVLPSCPTLDGVEKGQNNLMLRVSIPYRRYPSNNISDETEEHRITITTAINDSNK